MGDALFHAPLCRPSARAVLRRLGSTSGCRYRKERGWLSIPGMGQGGVLRQYCAWPCVGCWPVKFAYADPPYLGQGIKHYGDRHADAADCDTLEWHAALIERLCDEFPDGWALSLHTPSLKAMLNLCPEDVRVGAWIKPFAAYKANVTRAYAWEPIILRGGRPIPRTQPTVRDFIEAPAVKEPITMRKGFPGAKPAAVSWWIFDWLNMEAGDEFVDLFPGSGAVGEAHRAWLEARTGNCQAGLFGAAA